MTRYTGQMVWSLLAPLLALAAAGCATSSTKLSGGFAALSTPDARALSRWYQTMLRFTPLQEGASPDGRVRFALLRRGPHLIEIVQRADAVPPQPALADASGRHGSFKVGFVVNDVQAEEARLRAAGVAFNHGIVQPQGNPYRSFAVRDPDGNVVQLFGR